MWQFHEQMDGVFAEMILMHHGSKCYEMRTNQRRVVAGVAIKAYLSDITINRHATDNR